MREGVRMVDDILSTGDGMKDVIGEHYPWDMPLNSDEGMIKMILERSQTGFRMSTCQQGILQVANLTRSLRYLPTFTVDRAGCS